MTTQPGIYDVALHHEDADKLLEKNMGKRSLEVQLEKAVSRGLLGKVRDLIKQGAQVQVINDDGTYELTALHSAAFAGHLDICRYLVMDAGAFLNAQDRSGLTPLHRAAYNGHLEVVHYLLEAGADVWAVDKDCNTASQIASRYNQDSTAAELVRQMVERPPPVGGTPATDRRLLERRGEKLVGSRVALLSKKFLGSKSWNEGTTMKFDQYKDRYLVLFDGETKPKWVKLDPKNKSSECRMLIPPKPSAATPKPGASTFEGPS